MRSSRSARAAWRSGRRSPARSARPVEAADAGARVGRLAAQHRRDVEAALDREIANALPDKRADPQDLARAQAHALRRRKALPLGRRRPRRGYRSPRCRPRRRRARCRPPPRASAPGRRSPARPCPAGCRRAGWRRAGSRGRARPTPGCPGAGSPAGPGPAASSSGRARPPAARPSCACPARLRRLFRLEPQLARGRLGRAAPRTRASETGWNITLSPAASSAGRIAAHVPQRHRRAPEEMPAAGAFQRIDGGHGHGDGDRSRAAP